MLSDGVTSFLFGVGFGGWVYYKLMHSTGGNQKTSLIAAGLAGAAGFFVIFTLLKLILGV